MNLRPFLARAAVALPVMLVQHSASACAVCYGRSDSAMAHGFNWGILSLLVVVGFVLASIAAFFIFIIRRSAALAARPAAPAPETSSPAGSEKL
jgi:hypothetical protein